MGAWLSKKVFMPMDVTKSFWIGKFSKANQLASIERLARWMSQRVFGLKNILRHCILSRDLHGKRTETFQDGKFSKANQLASIERFALHKDREFLFVENFLRQKQTSKLSRVSQGNVIKSF